MNKRLSRGSVEYQVPIFSGCVIPKEGYTSQPWATHIGEIFKQRDMFREDETSSCLHRGADSAMKKLTCNVLLVLLWPSAAFAADAPEGGGSLLSLFVPLIAVTAALLGMLWWLRRGRALSGNGPMKVVQAVAVGARERVVVLDAQGRRFMLGVTPSKIELLAELRVTDTTTPS